MSGEYSARDNLLIDLAARLFFDAMVSERQGNRARLAQSHAGLLLIAKEISSTGFAQSVIARTASTAAMQQRQPARLTLVQLAHAAEDMWVHLCPELPIGPAYQFKKGGG